MSVSALVALALSFCFVIAGPASVTSTGSTVELNGISYFVPSHPFTSIPGTLDVASLVGSKPTDSSWVPITVVKPSTQSFGISELQDVFKTYRETDDVWSSDFLAGLSFHLLDVFLLIGWQASSYWETRRGYSTLLQPSQAHMNRV